MIRYYITLNSGAHVETDESALVDRLYREGRVSKLTTGGLPDRCDYSPAGDGVIQTPERSN